MRAMLVLFVALGVCSSLEAQARRQRGSLYGWAIVIDPGHGGNDPGASRMFGRERVAEDEYVYDVGLRVARLIRARQGLAFHTIQDGAGIRDWPASRIFSDARTERFALDNTMVRAGTGGLNKRLAFGNAVLRKYPKHRVVWISIHFDVVGATEKQGVRIIATDANSRLARVLGSSFGEVGRLRNGAAVVRNGDPAYGLRRLFVLGSTNRIAEKVLIELGNFNSDADLYRIRDPEVREAYALAIVRALENY